MGTAKHAGKPSDKRATRKVRQHATSAAYMSESGSGRMPAGCAQQFGIVGSDIATTLQPRNMRICSHSKVVGARFAGWLPQGEQAKSAFLLTTTTVQGSFAVSCVSDATPDWASLGIRGKCYCGLRITCAAGA